jgi:isocitrate/isopropylmalate dehydrogenase
MMLEFLGEADAANRVRAAVDKSDDVNGSTAEIGDAIAGRV